MVYHAQEKTESWKLGDSYLDVWADVCCGEDEAWKGKTNILYLTSGHY